MSSSHPVADSLASAVNRADGDVTILDDRLEVEDLAVFRWLRAHQLHRNALHRLVIGWERLPPAWRARALPFTTIASATAFLQPLARDTHAIRTLRLVAMEVPGFAGPLSVAELLRRTASALVSGAMWAIEARPIPNRFVGRTDPAAFAPINGKYGTQIDFAYIAGLEGNQWLRGYVPMRHGVVIGRSGMTVASGFDVGQWSPRQIQNLGLASALAAKLTPYAGHSFRHMKKAAVVEQVAKLGPVPELTKTEADRCDGIVFDTILAGAIAGWNSPPAAGVPSFTALPSGWQTVWLSRNYQEGSSPTNAQAIRFREAAKHGRWQDAITALRGYTDYQSRAQSEADMLSAAVPPIVPATSGRTP